VSAGPGSLVVSAAPWGTVSVDGNVVGNSPIMGMALTAGQHRVRIVRDGFEPYDRIVTVMPGETLRLTGSRSTRAASREARRVSC